MTRLEEPAYSQEVWDQDKACAYPFARVLKAFTRFHDRPGNYRFSKNTKQAWTKIMICSYLIDVDGDTEKPLSTFENYPEVCRAGCRRSCAKVETALNEVD